jgi:hypothetical protein
MEADFLISDFGKGRFHGLGVGSFILLLFLFLVVLGLNYGPGALVLSHTFRPFLLKLYLR